MIRIGDKVKMKHGESPIMTVNNVNIKWIDNLFGDDGRYIVESIETVWFVHDTPFKYKFHPDALRIVE